MTRISAGIACAFAISALADQTGKPTAEVGAKATQAVKEVFPDAQIGKIGTENEDGMNLVEVKFTVNGVKKEADVSMDGVLLEVEEKGEIAKLPESAAQALKKATQGMKAKYEIATTYAKQQKDASGTMTVTKLAQPTVAYEADVKNGDKKGEFVVDANGKILESPKWAESSEKEEKD